MATYQDDLGSYEVPTAATSQGININDAPVATPDTLTVIENSDSNITLQATDLDNAPQLTPL